MKRHVLPAERDDGGRDVHSTAQVVFPQAGTFLADVADWAGQRRPGLSAGDYVKESIVNPQAFISPEFHESGPVAMPSLPVTEAEIDALVAYLLER